MEMQRNKNETTTNKQTYLTIGKYEENQLDVRFTWFRWAKVRRYELTYTHPNSPYVYLMTKTFLEKLNINAQMFAFHYSNFWLN